MDRNLTNHTAAGALADTDTFYTVQGGNGRKGTLAQLVTYLTQYFAPDRLVPVTESGTSHVIQSTDEYVATRLTNAAGCTVIVPLNATEAVAVGARIRFGAEGAGGVTVDVEDPGVTLINREDFRVGAQGSFIELHKVDTNTWWLLGDLQE